MYARKVGIEHSSSVPGVRMRSNGFKLMQERLESFL